MVALAASRRLWLPETPGARPRLGEVYRKGVSGIQNTIAAHFIEEQMAS